MIEIALSTALVCFGLALLMNLVLLWRGPDLPDRILAVDTIVINIIALIVLYGIRSGNGLNFEAAMLLAMTGFVSTVAFCRYMLRGDVIDLGVAMIAEIVISLLLVTGGVFGLVGSLGLLKLRQPMQRLHAPTTATTIGVGAALLASIIYAATVKGDPSWQELLIIVFLFITSPVTANFLSKAHLHRTIPPESLPATGTDSPWATLETEDAARAPAADRKAP
jgi:multicomponent K+:H+ antiporter subunit G